MKIHRLELKNFRCFEQLELTFGDRFTLLAGDNGSGKSAVLEGLALGLKNIFHELHFQGMPGISGRQVRLQTTEQAHIPGRVS